MTSNLMERLRAKDAELMMLAHGVSNLRKPESDNDFGREAVLIREAADEIERLRAALQWIVDWADLSPDAIVKKAEEALNGVVHEDVQIQPSE